MIAPEPIRRVGEAIYRAVQRCFVVGALGFLLLPVLVVVPMSFSDTRFFKFPPSGWSLRWYEGFFASSAWMQATINTLVVAASSVILSTVLGTAAAYGLHLRRSALGKLVRVALLAPLVLPPIVIGVGLLYLLAGLSMVNQLPGIVLAHTALALPFVMIAVGAGLSRFDSSLEAAAMSLGANRLMALCTVTLPIIRPSIAAGAIFALVTSLDEAVVSIFIAGGGATTLPRRIFSSLRNELDPTIAVVSTLSLGATALCLAFYLALGRK